jgi:hypothetical protein
MKAWCKSTIFEILKVVMPTEESTATKYDFLSQENEITAGENIQQVDTWITTLQSFTEKQAEISGLEKTTVPPSISTVEEFLGSVAGDKEKIKSLKDTLLRLSKDRNISTSVADAEAQVQEFLQAEADLLRLELQYKANVAEVERLIIEEERQLFEDIAKQILAEPKRLLKGSYLKWLIHDGQLVPPYDEDPHRLSDHLANFRDIMHEYEDPHSVKSRFRRLSKKNAAAFATFRQTLVEIKKNSEKNRTFRDETWSEPGLIPGWTNLYSGDVLDRYQYVVYREAQRMQTRDTESDRVVALYDEEQRKISDVGAEMFDLEDKIKTEKITKITGQEVSEAVEKAYTNFSYLSNRRDSFKTGREVTRLFCDKLISLWQAKYGETHRAYQDRIDTLMEKRDGSDSYHGVNGLVRNELTRLPERPCANFVCLSLHERNCSQTTWLHPHRYFQRAQL